MLKINLNTEQKKELSQFLKDEVTTTLANRQKLEAQWAKWENQYEGKPEEAEKSFPWQGSSNVVVPVTGSIIDALLARVMDMWKVEPFFSVRSLNPMIDTLTKVIGQQLEWANKHELKLFQTMIPTILSTLKFGNGFSKLTWTMINEFTSAPGGRYTHIPLQNILFPSGCLNVHTSKWVCDKATYTFSDLKKLEMQGLLYNINKFRDLEPEEGPKSELDQEQEDLTTISSESGDSWTLYDFWLSWDINGDDIDEEIHVVASWPKLNFHEEK